MFSEEERLSLREVKQRNSVQPQNCAILTYDIQGFRLLKKVKNIKKNTIVTVQYHEIEENTSDKEQHDSAGTES